MNFKDYYKFPLILDPYCDIKVWTQNHHMAFDFGFSIGNMEPCVNLKTETKEKIVKILNGSDEKIKTPFNFTYENGIIYLDDLVFIMIRGWGYLTGGGSAALDLDSDKAIEIQNEFAEYIIKKLSNV